MPRILIVEDDTDINNSTAQYLRRQGCACVQAFPAPRDGCSGRRAARPAAGGPDAAGRPLPGTLCRNASVPAGAVCVALYRVCNPDGRPVLAIPSSGLL